MGSTPPPTDPSSLPPRSKFRRNCLFSLLAAFMFIFLSLFLLINLIAYISREGKKVRPPFMAKRTGIHADLAENDFRWEQGRYTDRLEELIAHSAEIKIDPGVTFVFGPISESGYTFTTLHAKAADRTFIFTESGQVQ